MDHLLCANLANMLKMFDYTKETVENIFIQRHNKLRSEVQQLWSDDFVDWKREKT